MACHRGLVRCDVNFSVPSSPKLKAEFVVIVKTGSQNVDLFANTQDLTLIFFAFNLWRGELLRESRKGDAIECTYPFSEAV